VSPAARFATRVLRQKRRSLNASGTVIAVVPLLTVMIVPVTAFSGRPPSATGGAKRVSRHVPVVTRLIGSSFEPASVSL